MLRTTSSQFLETGIAALRAGDHPRACTLLTQATQLDPDNEQAWLWLAGATTDRIARRSYLERVLALDPQSAAARQGLSELDRAASVSMPPLPPLFAPPADSSAGKTTMRLGFCSVATRPVTPAAPRGADDPFLIDYIISELRIARPHSDVVREVADRMGGTWSEAERVVAYVQQQQHGAIKLGRYWLYAMFGGLVLVAAFVLGGLYVFGKTLPPGVQHHMALSRPIINIIVLMTSGTFTLMGALFDMDWFLEHRGSRLVVALVGRNGARVVFGIFGLALIVLGALAMGVWR